MGLVLLKAFPPLAMNLYPLGFFGAPKFLHGENVVSSSLSQECKLSGARNKYYKICGLSPYRFFLGRGQIYIGYIACSCQENLQTHLIGGMELFMVFDVTLLGEQIHLSIKCVRKEEYQITENLSVKKFRN